MFLIRRDTLFWFKDKTLVLVKKRALFLFKNKALFLGELLWVTVELHTMTCDDDDMR